MPNTMLNKVKQFLYKPRKGRLYEFSSYLLYNKKAMRDLVNFIEFGSPIFYGLLSVLFLYFEVYVPFVIFIALFVFSAHHLYKHIKYKGYKSQAMNLVEVKNMILRKNTNFTYPISKVVSKVNKKYNRS